MNSAHDQTVTIILGGGVIPKQPSDQHCIGWWLLLLQHLVLFITRSQNQNHTYRVD
jgi:hypothetical protein